MTFKLSHCEIIWCWRQQSVLISQQGQIDKSVDRAQNIPQRQLKGREAEMQNYVLVIVGIKTAVVKQLRLSAPHYSQRQTSQSVGTG